MTDWTPGYKIYLFNSFTYVLVQFDYSAGLSLLPQNELSNFSISAVGQQPVSDSCINLKWSHIPLVTEIFG